MNHIALTQILSIIIFNETVFWFYVYAANGMTAIIADADEFNRDASDDECQTSVVKSWTPPNRTCSLWCIGMIFCLRTNNFSFSFVTSDVHIRTSQRIFFITLPPSLTSHVRFDGPHRQVQGRCTLIHGSFRKNLRYLSLSLSLSLSKSTSFLFVLRELPQFKGYAETMPMPTSSFAFMLFIHLLSSHRAAFSPRRVAWLPWLPSSYSSRSTAARHPHMAHYTETRKKSSISAAKLIAPLRSVRFFRWRDETTWLNDVAMKYKFSTRSSSKIIMRKNNEK